MAIRTYAMSMTLLALGHAGCTGSISAGGPDGPPGATPDAASPADGAGGSDGAPGPDGAPTATTAIAVWVGTGAYDPGGEGRIAPFVLDDGRLTAGTSLAVGSLPSWVASSPDGRFAYAVDENNAQIRSFSVVPGTGALTPIGDAAASGGSGPVHVVVDATGRWLLVAHYTSGNVAVLPIGDDGAVAGAPSDVEATGQFTHQIVVDPTNQFVFVPCVGANHIAQLRFDPLQGTLTRNTPATVASVTGAGPRHLALAPDGAHAYAVDETGSTVTAYRYDAGQGTLAREASISTLPDGFTGANTGAEIAIGEGGRFVYASNRGHDSIAVFSVGGGGALTRVANTDTGGTVPRSIAVAPGGAHLLVANQESSQLALFAIDAETGGLTASGSPITTAARAFFVGAFAIPAE